MSGSQSSVARVTFHWLFLLFAFAGLGLLQGCESLLSQPETGGEMKRVEYFVAKSGNDSNPGSSSQPFLTINHAAQIAKPGDTVTVKAGVYREYINPLRGGYSADSRITYRAAPGEDVFIMGSEAASGWEKQQNGTWLLTLPASFFGEFNPFNTLSRHPVFIKEDESGDGWGWMKYGRWTHLGDVYINREGLTEKQELGEVTNQPFTWHAQSTESQTRIWANFGALNPNDEAVEINKRPLAFAPEKPGLGYITFSGFIVMNVATHWAPPVPYQPAAIWANGGHHWVIENNIVMYAKGMCISIGNPKGEADQEKSGYHIIRNNVLLRCGQGGTNGQSWASHSQILNNHIEDVNYRKEFGGWETAAIKHHMATNVIVKGNFVRNVSTQDPEIGAGHGIWVDYYNTHWQVSGNLVMGAEANAILVEANLGPNLYDNNIFIGGHIATYSSRGDAWAHNLFLDASQKWENQPWGNRLSIGEMRWLNNVFVTAGLDPDIESENDLYGGNVFLNGALSHPDEHQATVIQTTKPLLRVQTDNKAVKLTITQNEQLAAVLANKVDKQALQADFRDDLVVDTDFYGQPRVFSDTTQTAPGPFSTLNAQEFTLYQFSSRYIKAKNMIGKQ